MAKKFSSQWVTIPIFSHIDSSTNSMITDFFPSSSQSSSSSSQWGFTLFLSRIGGLWTLGGPACNISPWGDNKFHQLSWGDLQPPRKLWSLFWSNPSLNPIIQEHNYVRKHYHTIINWMRPLQPEKWVMEFKIWNENWKKYINRIIFQISATLFFKNFELSAALFLKHLFRSAIFECGAYLKTQQRGHISIVQRWKGVSLIRFHRSLCRTLKIRQVMHSKLMKTMMNMRIIEL